jgi:SAM-dependent methyltransferase
LIAQGIGDGGWLAGLDISRGMLRQCQKKVRRRRLNTGLIEGEAAHLPLPDDTFDAVLHFGGINEFDDKKRAVEEMTRVAKPGARIVIGDEGVPPDERRSLRNRLLLRIYPLFAHEPPTDCIPPQAKDCHLTWFWGGTAYLIDFVSPKAARSPGDRGRGLERGRTERAATMVLRNDAGE